ncbi:MAG: EI24 domain-containing protein [Bacteroidetes bacterium]|nr:EI24 domain-containing protein [Bacteroidota bacterium]
MLKEIIIAFQSYGRAHQFVTKHRLWKWILIPGVLYAILFSVGMYFFWNSANDAVAWLSQLIHRFSPHRSAGLNFLVLMTAMMVHLVLVFFYFSLFKYLFLIICSPIFSYLSEQTEALINGKEYSFKMDSEFFQDMKRGIGLALRNSLWQTVYTLSILILSFIPLIGWITPVISTFVECYYYGFSMLDYSCMRHKLSPSASIAYIGQHKGLAIGNGIIFYGMHFVPVLGCVLAPAYAVIAATISLYHQNLE